MSCLERVGWLWCYPKGYVRLLNWFAVEDGRGFIDVSWVRSRWSVVQRLADEDDRLGYEREELLG